MSRKLIDGESISGAVTRTDGDGIEVRPELEIFGMGAGSPRVVCVLKEFCEARVRIKGPGKTELIISGYQTSATLTVENGFVLCDEG